MVRDIKLMLGACITGVGLTGIVGQMVLQHLYDTSQVPTDKWFPVFYAVLLTTGVVSISRNAGWNEVVRSWKVFIILSGIFIGGGILNILKGIVFQQTLRTLSQDSIFESTLLYDAVFLSVGCFFVCIGYFVKNMIDSYSVKK